MGKKRVSVHSHIVSGTVEVSVKCLLDRLVNDLEHRSLDMLEYFVHKIQKVYYLGKLHHSWQRLLENM